MMISHASLPADAPERVARFMAELIQGDVLPFPPGGSGAWIVWSKDAQIELQVMPRGAEFAPGPAGAQCVAAEGRRRGSETHIALCIDRPADEIIALAKREGWQAGNYERGGFFNSVEVWIENSFFIECFDPPAAARYREFMTPDNWRKTLESFAKVTADTLV
ncbi:MAG TPA: hypothetical protein VFG30_45085 [Polyangiales bacterium]|nr:hypothetical protein [Polyangiales bacterium]